MAIEVRGNAAQTDPVGTLRANRLSPRGAAGLVNLRDAEKAGQVVPFRAPSSDPGYPRVPARAMSNFLPDLAIR
jgi:hypothetical protein